MEVCRLRTVFSLTLNYSRGLVYSLKSSRSLPVLLAVFDRGAHTQTLTENMQYISNDKVKLKLDPSTFKLNQQIDKPLCIMMNYMMARPKHVLKNAELYLSLDFDVIAVSCTPWQLMWPVKGTQIPVDISYRCCYIACRCLSIQLQVVCIQMIRTLKIVIADRLLRFLEVNNLHSSHPLVVHGYSVGAYMWSELLVLTTKDKPRYQPVLDRVAAQVWDSGADIHEIPVGFPTAVFPKNKILQETFRAYIKTHMKIFFNVATKHYMAATGVFHVNPCKAPSLFLVSKTDPIGAEKRSREKAASWENLGIKCIVKCWDKSPHVQHYLRHPEEYRTTLYSHLKECGILKNQS